MNSTHFATATLCILLCAQAFSQTQGIDKELADLTEKLAPQIKDHGKKKVAVLDFTDLQGGASELGKYIAEQITVDFVMAKRDFSVLDRANLKSILSEHKLTATGLVDPENAKKLGMFAGVDALILGTMLPVGSNVDLTAKIITTDTAEVVGAAKARFKTDELVQQLIAHPATEAQASCSGDDKKDPANVTKSFGDLRVELEPLQIVNASQYVLTMTLTNQNPKKSLWVAVSFSLGGSLLRATVTDSEGNEFVTDYRSLSGVEYACNNGGFNRATEIKPNESLTATTKFYSPEGKRAASGTCRLRMEFLSAHDFRGGGTPNPLNVHTLVSKIEAP